MARRTAYEPCMLCMQLPCVCFSAPKPRKQAKKAAAPLPAKATPSSAEETPGDSSLDITLIIGGPSAALSSGDAVAPPAQKQDVRAAMRARVTQAPTPQPVADEAPDPIMDDAIRALAPLLDPAERRQYQDVLTQPRTVVRRAEAWRNRRSRGN